MEGNNKTEHETPKDNLTVFILSHYFALHVLTLSQCKQHLKQFKVGVQSIFLFVSAFKIFRQV